MDGKTALSDEWEALSLPERQLDSRSHYRLGTVKIAALCPQEAWKSGLWQIKLDKGSETYYNVPVAWLNNYVTIF